MALFVFYKIYFVMILLLIHYVLNSQTSRVKPSNGVGGGGV